MIAVTLFPPGEYARGKRDEWSWSDVVAYVSKPLEIELHDGASKDEISIAKARAGGFSLALFKGDRRAKENLERATALGLDFDKSTESPKQVSHRLSRYRHVIYSTFQHTAEHPRFRVIIELSRPVSDAEYSQLWGRVASRMAGIDTSAKDSSRLWYGPAHWAGRPYFTFECERLNPLDVDAVLRAIVPPRPARRSNVLPFQATTSMARRHALSMPISVSGQYGHDAAFAVARYLVKNCRLSDGDAWPILLDFNQRCEPPWTEKELRHKLDSARNAKNFVFLGRRR